MTTKPTKSKRWLATFAVFVGLSVVGFRAACSSLNPCANTLIARVSSPSGARSLVVFVRDCGATTSASPEVSLLDGNNELPNVPGNLLIIEPPGGPYLKPVRVHWQSDSTASIVYPAKSEVFKRVSELDSVSVTYQEE